jgi:hypothetical protein
MVLSKVNMSEVPQPSNSPPSMIHTTKDAHVCAKAMIAPETRLLVNIERLDVSNKSTAVSIAKYGCE